LADLYACNEKTSDYLVGKGLTSESSDYRYFYYQTGTSLTNALNAMPKWYVILMAYDWS
jgi:hypothetical protein